MKVELIRHQDLPDFIEGTRFRSNDPLPVSRQRARSHYHNPRALSSDVVLVLIYEDDAMLGYLGLIPDLIFIENAEERIAWMSCIWVSPTARGKGVAKRLLKEGYHAWEGRLIATEFTGPAKRLYDKTGYFNTLCTLHGQRFYLRSNLAYLLPQKRTIFQKSRLLLTITDTFFNVFNDLRLQYYSQKTNGTIQVKKIATITEEHEHFISAFLKNTFSRRGIPELLWLKNHPWLADDEMAKKDQQHYAFSVFSTQFSQQWYALFAQDKLVGLILWSVRDQHLKLPYVFIAESHLTTSSQWIIQEMIQQKINMLTCYQSNICETLLSTLHPFYLHKSFDREYLLTKVVNSGQPDHHLSFQDGDGDCGFT